VATSHWPSSFERCIYRVARIGRTVMARLWRRILAPKASMPHTQYRSYRVLDGSEGAPRERAMARERRALLGHVGAVEVSLKFLEVRHRGPGAGGAGALRRELRGLRRCAVASRARPDLSSQTVAQSVTQPCTALYRVGQEIQRRVAPRARADVCTIMQLAPPTPPRPSASHVRLRTPYPCELNTWERPGRRPTEAPPYAMCNAPDSAPYAHAPPHTRVGIPPAPPPANWANDQPLG
jgi:hypothetical protein